MMAAARSDSGVVVPQALPWQRRLAATVIAMLYGFSLKTWRLVWPKAAECPETQGPVILCVWHNRLAAGLASYDDFAQSRWPAQGLAAMISASRDGSLVANIAQRFGVQPIRGSTSRRGAQALLEATTWMERNYNVVMTPDGPRPPVYQVQKGIIDLAKLTGRPIIPTCNFTRWKIRLRSWDRFQIPLPFARVECYYGEPIWVPRDASDVVREELCAKLESSMRAITRD